MIAKRPMALLISTYANIIIKKILYIPFFFKKKSIVV